MRKWEALIEAERLKVSAPDVIYDYLSQLERPDFGTQNLPDEIVDTLVAMNHPLVNIGLARYASNFNKIQALWDRGLGVRLALLSNRNAGGVTPDVDDKKMIANGSEEEIAALLTNPSLELFRLARVIANEIGVDESKWQMATRFALRNDQLTCPLSETLSAAKRHYMSRGVNPINEAWRLYEAVEPTEAWAKVLPLMGLLKFDVEQNLSIADLIKCVEEKWKTPSSEQKEHLSDFYYTRAAFAQAVARDEPNLGRSFSDMG